MVIQSIQRSGRETLAALIVLTGLTISGSNLTACSLFTKPNAKTVLQVAEMACILYNEAASKPLPDIMTICQIDQALTPAVEQLLAARKQEMAMRRSALATDGGAP